MYHQEATLICSLHYENIASRFKLKLVLQKLSPHNLLIYYKVPWQQNRDVLLSPNKRVRSYNNVTLSTLSTEVINANVPSDYEDVEGARVLWKV